MAGTMKCYAIADLKGPADDDFRERVREVAEQGVDFLQVRAALLPARELARAAESCARLLEQSDTKLLINRRADVAAGVGAAGVHLPSRGMPVAAARRVIGAGLVGRSCHCLEDCRGAVAEGADYVLLGPRFAPRSKPGTATLSNEELSAAAALTANVFALGGLSRDNMSMLRGLPIAGIAGITLFMEDRPLGPIVEAVRAL